VRRSRLDRLREGRGAGSFRPVPLPPEAEAELRFDNPRVLELERRYRGHPAAVRSEWSEAYLRAQVPLPYFRADSAYVWQLPEQHDEIKYVLTTLYAREHDRLDLLAQLTEDGSFGAHTYEVDGMLVSRDLLDSVAELTFLEEALDLTKAAHFTVLDIGAGYGRFPNRATQAFENVTCIATDAVPLSTFLCEYYLRQRGSTRVEVVPLDAITADLEGRHIDLAVNIHSFSECPLASIEWWLDLLAAADAKYLFVVPNNEERFLSTEPSGDKRDFRPAIEARGFELVRSQKKYEHSSAVQEHGIFPAHYFLFARA
jgi:SAM-dependent methyltransferase